MARFRLSTVPLSVILVIFAISAGCAAGKATTTALSYGSRSAVIVEDATTDKSDEDRQGTPIETIHDIFNSPFIAGCLALYPYLSMFEAAFEDGGTFADRVQAKLKKPDCGQATPWNQKQ